MTIFDMMRSRHRHVAMAKVRMRLDGADEPADIWCRVEGLDVLLGGRGNAK